MNVVTAFAAVGLTAVSWDDTLSRAGARAFRHALDYREPYCRMSENEVVLLMDAVLAMRLERGTKALMLEAAKALTADQALTAYAMASELMRSDGPYSAEERRRLDLLALMLSISQVEAERIDSVFELLHAPPGASPSGQRRVLGRTLVITEPDAPATVGQTDHGALIALAAAAGTEMLFGLLKQLLQPDVVHGVA